MDTITGVFTAPRDGIYSFSLSGIKGNSTDPLWIYMRLNGKRVGAAYSSESSTYGSYSMESDLRLVKGDQVDLFLYQGTYYDSANYWTHFTGSLVDEDLLINSMTY